MKSVHSTGGEAFSNRCHLSIKRAADILPESVYYGFYSNVFGDKEDLPYGLSCLCDNKMSFQLGAECKFFFSYYFQIYDRIDFLYGLSWS